jgi:hypothetical protein
MLRPQNISSLTLTHKHTHTHISYIRLQVLITWFTCLINRSRWQSKAIYMHTFVTWCIIQFCENFNVFVHVAYVTRGTGPLFISHNYLMNISEWGDGLIICSMGTKSVHKHDYNVFHTARYEFEQWSWYTRSSWSMVFGLNVRAWTSLNATADKINVAMYENIWWGTQFFNSTR